ncbi:ABC transporter permease [Butyricimonas virosa]|jgi:ABC transporter, permease protein, putative|uniref:ABC transporter permease n=1 Tax=Butyricimonas virosa TaxID=544645 RepID=UPI0022E9012F|nr:ABC transporter permease [Butyricimonas virosa]MDY5533041.1 ABC transporter permease [Butyricimonas virosa]
MNKILIIINREFTTRVRKKTFLVVTIFVPILFALFYAFLMWMLLRDDSQERTIAVINESTLETPLQKINNTSFTYVDQDVPEADYIDFLKKNDYYAITRIPVNVMSHAEIPVFSTSQVPMELKNEIASQLRQKIESVKRAEVIAKTQMPDLEAELDATKTPVLVRTLLVTDTGDTKESSSEITSVIGLIAGLIIYFFIFMYASQVMKGVIEEKTNRIIEVLVSSVKPFQFLLGKIIGVAAVGLVQFLIWIVLGGGIILISQAFFMPNIDLEALKNANDLNMFAQGTEINPEQLAIIQNLVKTIDPMFILKFVGAFLFYFIGGYLLYASLFAAIGAAVDNETDSQQFMTPLSIILVVALYIGIAAMKSPESPMVFWSSLIPFTSPVVMLVRIPFGVPAWEIITSMGLLVGSFLFFTWLSGKIYRVGILMYGKKVTWKELYKWLRYKA